MDPCNKALRMQIEVLRDEHWWMELYVNDITRSACESIYGRVSIYDNLHLHKYVKFSLWLTN
jgi:hypothetical protein